MSGSKIVASFALLLAALASSPARAQEATIEGPYTAAQIASACPAGRTLELEVVVAGDEPGDVEKRIQVLEFANVTEAGATVVATSLDEKRKPLGDREESQITWEQMAKLEHPKSRTKRAEGELTTPAGKFACWVYTVAPEAGDPDMGDTKVWYAKTLPGPAVKVEVRLKDGKVAYTMTLVADSTGK